jgi:hypothetical protein
VTVSISTGNTLLAKILGDYSPTEVDSSPPEPSQKGIIPRQINVFVARIPETHYSYDITGQQAMNNKNS